MRWFDKTLGYVTLWVLVGIGFSFYSYAQVPESAIIDAQQEAAIRSNERDIQRNSAAIATMSADIREMRSALDRQSGIVFGFGIAITAVQFGIFVLQWKQRP